MSVQVMNLQCTSKQTVQSEQTREIYLLELLPFWMDEHTTNTITSSYHHGSQPSFLEMVQQTKNPSVILRYVLEVPTRPQPTTVIEEQKRIMK